LYSGSNGLETIVEITRIGTTRILINKKPQQAKKRKRREVLRNTLEED